MNLSVRINSYLRSVDYPFLFFLVGVTSVKLQVKIITILLYACYLLFNRIPVKNILSGPVKFYLLMPVIGILGAFFAGAFAIKGYWLGNAISIVIWIMCALSFLLLRMGVNYLGREKIQSTIGLFFLLNGVICMIEFIKMVIVSRHLFPYWYNEMASIYGVSSGDHLHGIFQDNSTVNAAITLLGTFYFLFIKKHTYAFICLVTCLLCTSNLTVLILLLMIGLAFLFYKTQRKAMFSTGIICLGLYFVISPLNIEYAQRVIHKLGKQITPSESNKNPPISNTTKSGVNKTEKDTFTRPFHTVQTPMDNRQLSSLRNKSASPAAQACVARDPFPEDSILNDFSAPIIANLGSTSLYLKEHIPEDTNALRRVMEKWYGVPYVSLPLANALKPGKILYLKQTYALLKSGITPFLLGAGPGNFSSKLALKMTGFKLQGTYPEKYRYISKIYFENTFFIHMFFWAKSVPDRSIINYPGSVYCQIGGEYGIAGLLSFFFFYISYFIKQALKERKKLIFIFIVLLLFIFDYWFEMLTLTIFFELFMLSDLSEYKKSNPVITEHKQNFQ